MQRNSGECSRKKCDDTGAHPLGSKLTIIVLSEVVLYQYSYLNYFFLFFSNHVENARLISSNLLNESWFELLLLLYMIVNLIFNLFKFYYFCFIFISSLSFHFFFVSEMFKGLKMNMNFIIFRRWIKFVFFQLLEISEYVIVMLVFSWNLLKIVSNISDLYFH